MLAIGNNGEIRRIDVDTVADAANKGSMSQTKLYCKETGRFYSYIVSGAVSADGWVILNASGFNGFWQSINNVKSGKGVSVSAIGEVNLAIDGLPMI